MTWKSFDWIEKARQLIAGEGGGLHDLLNFRIQFHGYLIMLLGGFLIPYQFVDHTKNIMGLGIFRIQSYGLAQRGERFLEMLDSNPVP